jgi:phosphohistidine swiveling domain-containing protein
MQPKYLKDKDPWMLAEDIPDSDVFFFQIPMSCFASDTSYSFLKNYKKVLTYYKKFHMDFYFGERDSFVVAESILQALLERPGFGSDVNKNVVKWSYKMIGFVKSVAAMPLKEYTNRQLWQLYEKHDQIHTKLYTYGWLPVALDMFHNNFTKKLKQYLYSVCENKDEAEAAFIVLTTPSKKTILAEEREQFLRIFNRYKSQLKQPSRALLEELNRHQENWGHLGYIFSGAAKPFDVNHYLGELKNLAETNVDAGALLRKEELQLREAKIKKVALIKRLKISRLYKNLFNDAADFAITKLIRRHAQLLTVYLLHKTLLSEIAKRLKFTRYQLQFMLKDEVRLALENKGPAKTLLKRRLQECVLYTEKNFEAVYVGKAMQRLTRELKKTINTDTNELTGQTAQPGYARGAVKIIIRAKDIPKMKKGDILLSIATDPDIVPAMKIASAIVTEQGGITSHAAIVSRELGIPCVIGTKIATKVFKDGDIIEVDANKGVVKKIKQDGRR